MTTPTISPFSDLVCALKFEKHLQQQKFGADFNLNLFFFYFFFAELNVEQVKNLHPNSLRAITENDFTNSLKRIRRSVAPHSLLAYEKWSEEYGDITM